MANYYEILSRALRRGDAADERWRRDVYGRTRQMLLQQLRAAFFYFQVWTQFRCELEIILKGNVFGVWFKKKIKGIDDYYFGDNFNLETERCGLFLKYSPRKKITKGILLPV